MRQGADFQSVLVLGNTWFGDLATNDSKQKFL